MAPSPARGRLFRRTIDYAERVIPGRVCRDLQMGCRRIQAAPEEDLTTQVLNCQEAGGNIGGCVGGVIIRTSRRDIAVGKTSLTRVAKHERMVAVIQVPSVHVLRQAQERAVAGELRVVAADVHGGVDRTRARIVGCELDSRAQEIGLKLSDDIRDDGVFLSSQGRSRFEGGHVDAFDLDWAIVGDVLRPVEVEVDQLFIETARRRIDQMHSRNGRQLVRPGEQATILQELVPQAANSRRIAARAERPADARRKNLACPLFGSRGWKHGKTPLAYGVASCMSRRTPGRSENRDKQRGSDRRQAHFASRTRQR